MNQCTPNWLWPNLNKGSIGSFFLPYTLFVYCYASGNCAPCDDSVSECALLCFESVFVSLIDYFLVL